MPRYRLLGYPGRESLRVDGAATVDEQVNGEIVPRIGEVIERVDGKRWTVILVEHRQVPRPQRDAIADPIVSVIPE